MKLALYCLAVLICLPLSAQAAMYKCKLPNGTVAFQDTPCSSDSEASFAYVSRMQSVSGSEQDAAGNGPAVNSTSTSYANSYGNQSNQQVQNAPIVVVRRIVPVHVWVAPVVRAERASPSNGAGRTSQPSHAHASGQK